MRVAVYVPLLIPALAALAARPLSRRLPPAAATWLLTALGLVTALASTGVLALLAATALVPTGYVAALGHLSARAFSAGDAVPLPVALAAGGLLAVAAAGTGRALRRRVAAVAAAGLAGPGPAGRRAGRGDRGHRRRRLHDPGLAVPGGDHPGHG